MTNVDVVAVYGLTPIMKKLGVKLQAELPPGSLVLSNVFSIPGWRAVGTSAHGTHIYMVPPKDDDNDNDDHSHDELPLLSKGDDDDDVSTTVLVAASNETTTTREKKEQDGK